MPLFFLPFRRLKLNNHAAPIPHGSSLAARTRTTKLSPREKRSLLRLPTEILEKVVVYLPPVAKVCLALTCKYCFAVVGEDGLDAEELRFPQLGRTPDDDYIPFQMPMGRWTFLGMLENDRLLYCSRCLKLHPTKMFASYRRDYDRDSRYCDLNAGIVEICPCIRLTWCDKIRLARYLKNPTVDNPERSYVERRKKLMLADGALKHQCTHEYKDTKAHLHVEAILDDGSVVFRTKFNMSIPQYRSSQAEQLPCKVCEHRSIRRLLISSPKTIEYYLSKCTSSDMCDSCETAVSDFTEMTVDGKDTFSWKAKRVLGNGSEEPDKEFYEQTNLGYRHFNEKRW